MGRQDFMAWPVLTGADAHTRRYRLLARHNCHDSHNSHNSQETLISGEAETRAT